VSHIQAFRSLLVVVLTIAGTASLADKAFAAPVVKLSGEGSMEFSAIGPSSFTLSGNASQLGKYTCCGEIVFVPGDKLGTLEGTGFAAIRSANGDLIVGAVTWHIDQDGNGQISFHWLDSVEFSDGTVVSSTGRFSTSRPAGAVSRTTTIKDGTSNIIAILIG
jgi:hypothetical protein